MAHYRPPYAIDQDSMGIAGATCSKKAFSSTGVHIVVCQWKAYSRFPKKPIKHYKNGPCNMPIHSSSTRMRAEMVEEIS